MTAHTAKFEKRLSKGPLKAEAGGRGATAKWKELSAEESARLENDMDALLKESWTREVMEGLAR